MRLPAPRWSWAVLTLPFLIPTVLTMARLLFVGPGHGLLLLETTRDYARRPLSAAHYSMSTGWPTEVCLSGLPTK
jgi:hypothetical protein